MSKFLKVFSVVLALSVTINFFSFRKVNAVDFAVVGAASLAAALTGLAAHLIADGFKTVGNAYYDAVSSNTMEERREYQEYLNRRDEALSNMEGYFNHIASDGTPYYEPSAQDICDSFADEQSYLDYCGVSSASELSQTQYTGLRLLNSLKNNSSAFSVGEDGSFTISSDKYIGMQHDFSGNVFEDLFGENIDFSYGEARLYVPASSVLLPSLKSQYNFLNCYKPLSGFSKNASGYNFLVDSFSGTHYFVGVYDVKNAIFKKPFPASYVSISPFVNGSNKSLWQSFGIKIDWSYSFIVETVGIFQYENSENLQSTSLGLATFTPFRDYPMNYDSHIGYLKLQTTFDDCYLFEFSTEEEAQSFIDGISVDTTYDPSKDLPIDSGADEVVLNPGFSDTELSVKAKQYENGNDKAVDLTFAPDLSIDGTKEEELEDVKESENFKEWMEQNKFVPALSDPDFELYDQCKELLQNLFNYNDLNTPPSFKFYYDSDGDGTTETYDVLDLSVLETTLSNDNMQDKSWWVTDIKVIDVIRYVIAAILYGLFIMRLIKRLPTFYGSGPWADM